MAPTQCLVADLWCLSELWPIQFGPERKPLLLYFRGLETEGQCGDKYRNLILHECWIMACKADFCFNIPSFTGGRIKMSANCHVFSQHRNTSVVSTNYSNKLVLWQLVDPESAKHEKLSWVMHLLSACLYSQRNPDSNLTHLLLMSSFCEAKAFEQELSEEEDAQQQDYINLCKWSQCAPGWSRTFWVASVASVASVFFCARSVAGSRGNGRCGWRRGSAWQSCGTRDVQHRGAGFHQGLKFRCNVSHNGYIGFQDTQTCLNVSKVDTISDVITKEKRRKSCAIMLDLKLSRWYSEFEQTRCNNKLKYPQLVCCWHKVLRGVR